MKRRVSGREDVVMSELEGLGGRGVMCVHLFELKEKNVVLEEVWMAPALFLSV